MLGWLREAASLRFAFEASLHFGVVQEVRIEDLEGNGAFEAGVDGFVDDAHTAAAVFRDDAIGPDARAGRHDEVSAGAFAGRRLERESVEDSLGAVGGSEEPFHLLTDRAVAAAGLIDPIVATLGRNSQRLFEDCGDPTPGSFRCHEVVRTEPRGGSALG